MTNGLKPFICDHLLKHLDMHMPMYTTLTFKAEVLHLITYAHML